MPIITMKELLEAGVHFGHQTKRWNPKMKKFLFGERNGIYIIDLIKTQKFFHIAYKFVRDTVAEGRSILFVGTKRQAQEIVQEEATRSQMFYVNQRWLGGMLTNFQTIKKNIKRLKKLETGETDGSFDRLTKKEVGGLKKDRIKLNKFLSGIKNMSDLPGAVFIVDTKKEHIAVREARRLKIPIIAILDSNCDPDDADVIIPGNDDALRGIRLLTSRLADAALEGLELRAKNQAQPESKPEPAPIPPKAEGETAAAPQGPSEAPPSSTELPSGETTKEAVES